MLFLSLTLVINCVKLVSVSITIISLNIQKSYQQQSMTRIRDKKVRESIEYFQQCMTRVRDNSVMEGKGSNKYLQQFMTRIRDNKVRR